jgi:hypothetical protein
MLQQIEERLRRENPDLGDFLAGRSALRRPRAVIGAIYLVLPVIVVLGLALDVAVVVVAGVVAAPLIPGQCMAADPPSLPLSRASTGGSAAC